MFYNCTGLTALPPSLPASTLTNYCYDGMFKGCTSISTIPSNYLSASVLTGACYRNMFAGCTSLTNAPILSATLSW